MLLPGITRRLLPEISHPSAEEVSAAVTANRTDSADQAVYGAPLDSYRRSTAAWTQLGQVAHGEQYYALNL